ncbi:hypothetical protein JGS6364_03531 [[Clostridium] sordellii]|uniref:hypothetical protein n=1 Tax=Paraclostridium sordellii TaxID=1505 RepID=UPI0002F84970|nr:hypothetical protein [Paeniclostridium sordellii]CEK29707.1 hypothetical protein JGS6364_03531 [[Clostridium] sordellii] [Paeniclostridium sordellii]
MSIKLFGIIFIILGIIMTILTISNKKSYNNKKFKNLKVKRQVYKKNNLNLVEGIFFTILGLIIYFDIFSPTIILVILILFLLIALKLSIKITKGKN